MVQTVITILKDLAEISENNSQLAGHFNDKVNFVLGALVTTILNVYTPNHQYIPKSVSVKFYSNSATNNK